MSSDEELRDAEAHANAVFAGIQLYTAYMETCLPLIRDVFPRRDFVHRDDAIKLIWMRAYAWMQSLLVLDRTRHFQAISAGNRSMLEFAVDLILLHTDQSNLSGWKMYHFAFSERLKAAEQLVGFYGEGNVPAEHSGLELFIQQHKSSIEHMRTQLWPDPRNPKAGIHPDRWSGRNLFDDAVAADVAFGQRTQNNLGVSLTEYYRTEYRKMNWLIHSSFAGVADLDRIYYTLAAFVALKWCQELAMFCTKITLIDQRYTDAIDSLDSQWARLRDRRDATYKKLRDGEYSSSDESS